MSPFHLAIQSNSIKCLDVFLAHLPADILEYPDTQGRKPLTLSITEGNLEAFMLLLNAGVDLINTDTSPLHLSAQCGQTEMLELLLKSVQVNVGETNDDGQTIAHIAATQSSPEMIQLVARYRPELLQSPDNRGITPLMYACGYGIDTNVKTLIKKKVSVIIYITASADIYICKVRQTGLLDSRHHQHHSRHYCLSLNVLKFINFIYFLVSLIFYFHELSLQNDNFTSFQNQNYKTL